MVVSEATRVQTHRDKAPIVGTSMPAMVEDASEISRVTPRAAQSSPPEREAYVTVDALKSLLPTMAYAITRQVSKQVKKAVDVAGSNRPVHREEPFH